MYFFLLIYCISMQHFFFLSVGNAKPKRFIIVVGIRLTVRWNVNRLIGRNIENIVVGKSNSKIKKIQEYCTASVDFAKFL